MAEEIKEVLNELKEMRMDINFIKDNMPDKEMFLDSQEKELLAESFENEKKGKLISSESAREE